MLKDRITRGKELPTNWQYKGAFFYIKDRQYIPADNVLNTKIATGYHHLKVAGHFGKQKTIYLITREFYWKGLTDWINNYVRSCYECQYKRSPQHVQLTLLKPLEKQYAAWNSISNHFITKLLESRGYTQIIVVVDQFTKMAYFIGPLTNKTAKNMTNNLLQEDWKFHYRSTEIMSEMKAKLSGQFSESISNLLGIKRKMSTVYYQ